MGRIDPKLIIPGEESNIKIVKFKGTTSVAAGHQHNFVVYEDDTVEIFAEKVQNKQSGEDEKHTHEYFGEYPHGFMSKVLRSDKSQAPHSHEINSISFPIKLHKQVYGKNAFDTKVNKDFNEFLSKSKSINVKEFFGYYNQMFYEIPKSGQNSHKSMIDQSTDYIGDFIDSRDGEIIDLTLKIVELEQKIAKQDGEDKEHPIFKNGTFLKQPDNKTIYYMDKGVKREITDFDTYLVLKRVNGHELDKPDEEVYILITEDVIKGLETGAKFSSEDLYGDVEQRDEQEEKRRIELDPDDFKANPSNYDNISDYIAALDRETRQLLAKEEYVQELYYRYKADSENITDMNERNEAAEKFQDVQRELYQLRRKILKYTDILESVDPDGDLINIEIDTSQLKAIIDEKMSKEDNAFTQEELHQLRFKENRIERFLNNQGRATYNRPNSSPSGGGGGGSNSSNSSTSNILDSVGLSGMGAATEPMPKTPPNGFTPNGNKTVKNHNLEEAIRAMRLGEKSSGGNYYWTLKLKST